MKSYSCWQVSTLSTTFCPSWTSKSNEGASWYWCHELQLCLLPFVWIGHSGVLKELCDAGEPWTMVSFIHYPLSELDFQEFWRNSDVGEPWTMFSFINNSLSELDFRECWRNFDVGEPWTMVSSIHLCPSWTSRSFEGILRCWRVPWRRWFHF